LDLSPNKQELLKELNKTPTRLFLLPYSSFYVNANGHQNNKGTLKGGMDIKYGINDAFTLDAI
jgi:hypothetical protein